MATYASATFNERSDGNWSSPEGDTALAYTVYHIPGGDTNVLISTGQQAKTFEVPFQSNGSALSTLQGALGSSGSLVWSRGTTTSCVLVGVLDVKRFARNADRYEGKLRFVKL